jgi:hypothetical protein
MTIGGWVTMILSVGFVTFFFGWSIVRVIRTGDPAERLHAPPTIDTGDLED